MKNKKYQKGGSIHDDFLQAYAKEKGIEDIETLKKEIDRIAFHESKGDYSAKQTGGGPGRGGFQFEMGKDQGAHTAYNRLKDNPYDMDFGDEFKSLESNNYDVSNLSPEAQRTLFIANDRRHPKADFSKVVKGDLKSEDYWFDYHNASGKPELKDNFVKDSLSYDQKILPKKNLGGVLSAVGGSANPYIAGAQVALKVGALMKSSLDETKQLESTMIPDVNQVRNPFMKQGGTLDDNIAVGNSHDNGGIPVGKDGEFNPRTPVAEIEGNEPKTTYSQLPDKAGKTYILPTKYKKTVEKLNDKFKNSDMSNLDLAAKEFELSRLENENESNKARFTQIGLPKGETGIELPSLNPFVTPNNLNRPSLMFDSQAPSLDSLKTPEAAPEPKVDTKSSFMDKLSSIQDAKSIFEGVSALTGMQDTTKIYNKEVGDSKQLVKETLKSDFSSQQEEVQRGLSSALSSLRNNVRSGGAFGANAVQAKVASAQNAAKLKFQQEQTMNDRKVNAAQLLPNLEELNRQEDIRTQTIDQQNTAAGLNIIGKQFQDYINLEKTGENLLNHQKSMVTSLAAIDAKNPDIGLGPLIQSIQNARTSEEISAAIKELDILRYKTGQ